MLAAMKHVTYTRKLYERSIICTYFAFIIISVYKILQYILKLLLHIYREQ
jgi:hypothetical protein